MKTEPSALEANFDGLVGPTHNYSGLSFGNVASVSHRKSISNPKEAALQGLKKAKFLADLGLVQGILPPLARPDLSVLKRLGFSGSKDQILKSAHRHSPELLQACFSASSMWTANAATVTPSADSADGKIHFTAANLNSKFHRSLEPEQTSRVLKAIFPDEKIFSHHDPLPESGFFGDEGAANHNRFCESYGSKGLEFFVYGRSAFSKSKEPEPKKFPARQTSEASHAISRLHLIRESHSFFAKQNPAVIDAGVFHNDVISVANQNFFFTHEKAFLDQKKVLRDLKKMYLKVSGGKKLCVTEVKLRDVTVADAVSTYLFNSQVVSIPGNEGMALIAPSQCEQNRKVSKYLKSLIQSGESSLTQVYFFDLKESMRNGGGPACLRLRVVLTDKERKAVHPDVFLTDSLYEKLCAWVNKHYRDRLSPADLLDVALVNEVQVALDELTQILKLKSIYSFQK